MNNQKLLSRVFIGGALIVVGVLLADIVRRTGGVWYTLDDPYIHLRLSELIREGGYGINRGEYAAPSSSILFPLLLAPAAHLFFHPYVPLLLNVVATGFSLWVLAALMAPSSLRGPELLVNALPVFSVCFSLNLFGVIFTGLEHSLHIAASIGIVLGLVRTQYDGRVSAWLVALIVVCPLLRFEGAALSTIALLILLVDGHRAAVAVATALLGIALGLWVWFMQAHGLPVLPSSVLIKSSVVADTLGHGVNPGWRAVIGNVRLGLATPGERGVIRLAVIALCALAVAMWQGDRKVRAVALRLAVVVAVSVAAHLCAGKYGWFARYELYVKFICVAATVWTLFGEADLFARVIAGLRHGPWRSRLITGASFLLLVAGVAVVSDDAVASRELEATLLTPLAAHNIYAQQEQMARFAHDYARVPAAVNDIGLVSYRSDNYVLDLFGQGSEQTRNFRARVAWFMWAAPDGWMERLARQHDVQLVMVYDAQFWFPGMPQSWCRLGFLELLDQKVTPYGSQVAFFGTDAAATSRLRKELQRYVPTLPTGSRFVFAPNSGNAACGS